MNEQIRKLWEQSTGASVPAAGFFSSASAFNIEKFAELIIEECIKCCDDLERTNQYYISKFGLDPDIRPTQCIEVIKQHFGVQE